MLFLMGEKLAVPWMFPSTFHFLNTVLSVHHLTSHQRLRKENHALFAAVHNYQPFKTDLFATLNDVVNLCTNKRQAIFCCKSSSSSFSFSSFRSPSRVFKIYGVASVRSEICCNSLQFNCAAVCGDCGICALIKH